MRWSTHGCGCNDARGRIDAQIRKKFVREASPIRQFLRTSGLGRWGLAVSVLLVLMAVFAPMLAPRDPAAQSLPERLLPPGAHHWMGTDELGRDVLSRT